MLQELIRKVIGKKQSSLLCALLLWRVTLLKQINHFYTRIFFNFNFHAYVLFFYISTSGVSLNARPLLLLKYSEKNNYCVQHNAVSQIALIKISLTFHLMLFINTPLFDGLSFA